jgi:hypothetical protein
MTPVEQTPREKAEEALRLSNRAMLLTRFQIFHMWIVLVIIAVPLFADSDVVTYGAWAICLAIFIHDRFTAREVRQLQKRAHQLYSELDEIMGRAAREQRD